MGKDTNLHKYCLAVPINQIGIDHDEYLIDDDENIIYYYLSDREVDAFWDSGIDQVINYKYNLMIDLFEDETVPWQACEEAISELRKYPILKDGKIIEAMINAVKFKTYVAMYL